MEDLEAYLDKFSESGKRILESAFNETRQRNQNFISPEHLLYVIIIEEFELFNSTMESLSMDAKTVRLAVEKRLENSRQHIGQGFRIAPEATEIFKFSMDRARSQGRRVIEAEDIITIFVTVKRDLFDDIWQNPESQIEVFQRNRLNPNYFHNPQQPKSPDQIEFESKQLEIWQKFHEEQKKFLSKVSLETVIKNNKLLSTLSALDGGGGSGGGGGVIGDEMKYTQNSSSSFSYKLANEGSFNQTEIINSLKNDVKNCLKQNHLEITKMDSLSSTSFSFEYKGENLTGQIKVVGEIMNNHFQLSVNQNETSVRKK